MDASEPAAISGVKPETATKLLNINFKEPLVNIHPASFYNSSEGNTYTSVINLKAKPQFPVTLTPTLSDSMLGILANQSAHIFAIKVAQCNNHFSFLPM